jgi:hypothetical protein
MASATGTQRHSSWRERIETALRREQMRSQQLGVRVIMVAFPLIVTWITFENGIPGAFSFYPLLAVLAVVLIAPYLLHRAGAFAPWQNYVFALVYVLLVTRLVLIRDDPNVPLQLYLSSGNEAYLFIILVGSVFTFSPRVIVWTGVASVVAWSAVTLWILYLPDSIGVIHGDTLRTLSVHEQIELLTDPHRVRIDKWIR